MTLTEEQQQQLEAQLAPPIEGQTGDGNTSPAQQPFLLEGELTADDLNRVYTKLGRPESPDLYDFSGIVPDTYDQSAVEEFKKQAFENSMSKDGARKLAEWYKAREIQSIENYKKSQDQQRVNAELTLRTEWGSNYDSEVKNALKAVDTYGGKEFKDYLNTTGLGNHPALVKAFAKIGRELSEDKLIHSETAKTQAHNLELQKAEIARLRSDKAFMELYRRGDAAAVSRLNRLYQTN